MSVPLPGIAKKAIRVGAKVAGLAYGDFRTRHLSGLFPQKPNVVNLLVNDICNSGCQMCNIWQQKRDFEFSPDDLTRALNDPLFSEIQHVGISGGEPTLRKDLPELYRVLVQKKPRIVSAGIITNAIRADDVISRVHASYDICAEAGIPFSMMVSLDGVGEVHDLVRGRKGNFESALKVIRYFRENTKVPVLIGATITKDNVWHVDELLEFLKENNLYGRFRIAEFIKRLYNDNQGAYIRSFTPEEKYHLGLFFVKLIRTFEKERRFQRTYENIRGMLMEDRPRIIKCPYQNAGVVLDCRGQLLYCAPKSPILGSTLKESALTLYRRGLRQRTEIIKKHCDTCIHDYHADESLAEWRIRFVHERYSRRLTLDKALETCIPGGSVMGQPGQPPLKPGSHHFITGWYGTETAGDKAILGQLIFELRERDPSAKITVASIYPYVTEWTLKELGCKNVAIVPVYSKAFFDLSAKADEVIIGGGPLMHLEELGFLLQAFYRAKKSGHRTRIAGCGIGPLHAGERFQKAVTALLQLADEIQLRDSGSIAAAEKMAGIKHAQNTGCPAARFVRRWAKENTASNPQPYLNLYLRDLPREYFVQLSDAEFAVRKQQFEKKLAGLIRLICQERQLKPRLLAMHHFTVGNDDREYNRHLVKTYLSDLQPVLEEKPFSAQQILQSMRDGVGSICMRFHSVLFADELNIPYLALDYTSGGKIAGYLHDGGRLDRMASVDALIEKNPADWLGLLRA